MVRWRVYPPQQPNTLYFHRVLRGTPPLKSKNRNCLRFPDFQKSLPQNALPFHFDDDFIRNTVLYPSQCERARHRVFDPAEKHGAVALSKGAV